MVKKEKGWKRKKRERGKEYHGGKEKSFTLPVVKNQQKKLDDISQVDHA